MGMWPFRRQADEAERLLTALLELHAHVDSAVAGGYMAEAERELRRAAQQLQARADQ